MNLAYKYVGLAVLLLEANFNAERLNLPVRLPVEESHVKYMLASTNILHRGGFMGRIDVGQYSFGEGGRRHRRHVVKLDPLGKGSVAERNEVLSRQQSLVTTNEAYQLAVRWLTAIDVDVHELQKTNSVEVQQRWFWSKSKSGTKVFLPVFDVRWGMWDNSKIDVVVDGRTREFLEVRQHDDTFSRRPADLIKNMDDLLAISDEEFQSYSALQRSNLVARFAVNWPGSSPLPAKPATPIPHQGTQELKPKHP